MQIKLINQNKTRIEEIRKEEIESKNEKIFNLEKELLLRSENFFDKENFSNPFSHKKKNITTNSKILSSLSNSDNLSALNQKFDGNILFSKKKYKERQNNLENDNTLKDEEDSNRKIFVEKAINLLENIKKNTDIVKDSSSNLKQIFILKGNVNIFYLKLKYL